MFRFIPGSKIEANVGVTRDMFEEFAVLPQKLQLLRR